MPDSYGIRTMAERILVRFSYTGGCTLSEMTLDEAKQCRALLDGAIKRVESGITVADDLATLIVSVQNLKPYLFQPTHRK